MGSCCCAPALPGQLSVTVGRSSSFIKYFLHTLLCALCLWPALAGAQDWNYRVRPGDTLWDLGAAYLKPSIGWQQLQQHNRIDNPYRLPPGELLRFPIGWLRVEPAPARVLAVRGQVELSAADGSSSRAVRAGEQLHIGDAIQTKADSSITLEFADASRLQLREYSRLRLDQLSRYGRTGMVDTRLRLQQGRARNRVTPARGPASRYIIDAPTATSSVPAPCSGSVPAMMPMPVPPRYWRARCRSATRMASVWCTPARPAAAPAAERRPKPFPVCCRHRACVPMRPAWEPCRPSSRGSR